MTICETFKRLAFDSWDKINEGRSVNFQLKEETLTDINILSLKRRHGNNVKTKTFTKREEGTNGADWEWWFKGAAGRWLSFRVQAKVININSDSFEHLHYKDRSGVYQCDRLITHAFEDSHHPKFPLYRYFINTENPQNLPGSGQTRIAIFDGPRELSYVECLFPSSTNEFYGCSLTSAFTVQKLRRKKTNKLVDLRDTLKPWHCLVCSRQVTPSDFLHNLESYATTNFPLDRIAAQELNVVIPDTFIIKEPPPYILAIDQDENAGNIEPPDGDLDGAIIIHEA